MPQDPATPPASSTSPASPTPPASTACPPPEDDGDSFALPAAAAPRDARGRRLRQLAANRMEAPWRVCFRRACRRNRGCSTWDPEIEEPICVWNLNHEGRRIYFIMVAIAEAFDTLLQSGTLADWCRNRNDTERDRRQLSALEIIDMLAPGDPRRLAEFRNFWRAEEKMRVSSQTGTHSGNDTVPSAAAYPSSST